MPLILIIEDDPKIIEAVEKTISLEQSYVLKSVKEPQDAVKEVLKHKPDIILLDVKLPGTDGRVLLKALKENAGTRLIPVIFLTGMSSEGDKVLGLNLGADDYVVKPFGAMELLARLQSVLRRYHPQAAQKSLRFGDLSIDLQNRSVVLDGKPLAFQPREFEILYLLASHPGRPLARSYLIENSSSYGLPVSTRSLDTHIKNIRKKLRHQAGLIETVSKQGYRFRADG